MQSEVVLGTILSEITLTYETYNDLSPLLTPNSLENKRLTTDPNI